MIDLEEAPPAGQVRGGEAAADAAARAAEAAERHSFLPGECKAWSRLAELHAEAGDFRAAYEDSRKLLAAQTERLLELAVDRSDWVVKVRPEMVVEVAFDGVQTSRRYPGGMALRFARVLRHRPDKRADEADTIDAVRAIYAL